MISCAILCLLLTAAAEPDANEIVRKAIGREVGHRLRLANYTWQERRVTKESSGAKPPETRVWDHFNIDGTSYRKLIEKDGKPLPPNDARKEQEKMDQEMARRRNETESQRSKRLDAERKELDESIRFREEVMKAFTFRLEGDDKVNGFNAWRIAADPRAGFQPKSRQGSILSKIQGRIWVDKQSNEWLKFEMRTLEKISFAGFIATIAPGAVIAAQQMRVNDELWHPEWTRIKLNARALWKRLDGDIEQTYRNFRKFQAESRILEVSEVEKQQVEKK
jgi:hypothetical protein